MGFVTSSEVGVLVKKPDGSTEYIDPVDKSDAITRSIINAGACSIIALDKFIPSRVAIADEEGTIQPSPITTSELSSLDNISSNIQNQINAKQSTLSSSNRLNATNISTGVVSNTEFNYLNGTTANLQGQINTLKSDTASSKKAQLMKYPTNTAPYWAFMSVNRGNHSIQINLSGNKVVFNNQVLIEYYMAVTEHNQTSANSTLSTATTKMRRTKLATTGSLDALIFNSSGNTKARVILSAYGGTYFAPLVFDFDIFRHDSNNVIVHCEFNELINV